MLPIFQPEDRTNSINLKTAYGQGYVFLFSYGYVDLTVTDLGPITLRCLNSGQGEIFGHARAPRLRLSSRADPTLFWMLLRRPVKHNGWAHAPSIKRVSLWGKERCLSFFSLQWSLITSIPSKNIKREGLNLLVYLKQKKLWSVLTCQTKKNWKVYQQWKCLETSE